MRNKKTPKYKDIVNIKPGQIKFVPIDDNLAEIKPYINNFSSLPQWFRNMGKHQGSVRSCPGTVDYLTSGATLRFWTNAHLKPDMREDSKWSVEMDSVGHAPYRYEMEFFRYGQVGKCPMTEMRSVEKSAYPKFVNPWNVITAPGWSTLVVPPLWEMNNNYHTLGAIVNTDYYHTLNWVINITTDKPFSIKAGTPIMHLIPFKRDSDFSEVIIGSELERPQLIHRGLGKFQLFPNGSTGKAYRIVQKYMENFLKGGKGASRDGF